MQTIENAQMPTTTCRSGFAVKAPEPSRVKEELLTLVGFCLAVLLLFVCLAAPIQAARASGPVGGLLTSCATLLVWIRFGPRPMPGLIPGILCLSGVAAIATTGVVYLVMWICSCFT